MTTATLTDTITIPLDHPLWMPVPDDIDGPERVFGAQHPRRFLTEEALTEREKAFGITLMSMNGDDPYRHAASHIFFKGGRLTELGLHVKAGLNRAHVFSAVQALLGSFAVSHEIKIGTVAFGLRCWCDLGDVVPPEPAPAPETRPTKPASRGQKRRRPRRRLSKGG